MTAENLVYFGSDFCYRLPVLRSAGYRVVACSGLPDLSRALAVQPDAILLAGECASMLERAASTAQSESSAPLVLFAAESGPAVQAELVIPPLTTPDSWLMEIRGLLDRACRDGVCRKKIASMSERPNASPLHRTAESVRQRGC